MDLPKTLKLICALFGLQAPMYYRRANAAIIVYDITSENSFDEAMQWIKGTCTLCALLVHTNMCNCIVHVLYVHC